MQLQTAGPEEVDGDPQGCGTILPPSARATNIPISWRRPSAWESDASAASPGMLMMAASRRSQAAVAARRNSCCATTPSFAPVGATVAARDWPPRRERLPRSIRECHLPPCTMTTGDQNSRPPIVKGGSPAKKRQTSSGPPAALHLK